MAKPTATFHLEIHGASVTRAELEISGAAGIRVDMVGATSNRHNIDKIFTGPLDFTIPIGHVLGVPLNITATYLVGLRTVFSAKTGGIRGSAEWSFGGSLGFGYADGRFGVRKTSEPVVKSSLTDSITGVSVGVSGLTVLLQGRFAVGIGMLGFTAGAYIMLTTTVTITMGSAAGAPLTVCRGAQLGIWISYGIGYRIPAWLQKVINAFLSLFNATPISQGKDLGRDEVVFSRAIVRPDVPLCH